MEERLLAILRLALKYNATDIHFNQKYNEMIIEMRVNGTFKKLKSKNGDEKIIRYLQYLANLDIGNLLEPQTGQFEMEVDNNLLSLRFAVINTVDNANGVLRILNNRKNIDIEKPLKQKLINSFNKQGSVIILAGKKSSGKTTLAYEILNCLKNKKIYTLEDPIEVYNDNFIQLQINKENGFDFENGVKQILRHDPDIIFVSEMNIESAGAVVKAAKAGCSVLTTLTCDKNTESVYKKLKLSWKNFVKKYFDPIYFQDIDNNKILDLTVIGEKDIKKYLKQS